MDTLACFVYRFLFLGTVLYITASANLMMEYNWPAPDLTINRFPHEKSCHFYYLMLSEEDITIQKCPDGQLFDYTKHSCISDKEHIHCWSRHFGKIKHDHTLIKHKKHFKCPYPWGKYANLHDCSKYHLCLHGKSSVKKCAPFELFDKISRKCIASIDAVCADKTDVVEHGYVCPKTWGSFTYRKDCSKYYECLQRKPSLRMCQKGYLFDDRLAKCAEKEHVYCGLRHNPYEKVNPETPSVPSTTSTQKSPTLGLDLTTITATKQIATVKPVSQEIKSTPQETSSTFKEITLLPQEASSTIKEITSLPQEASSTIKEITSLPQEASSTIKEITSLPQEASPTIKEITSTEAPVNQPISSEISSPSAGPDTNVNEMKQDSSISTAFPNVLKSEGPQLTNEVAEDVSDKNEFVEVSPTPEKEQVMLSSQTVFEESDNLKKDVSTEEIDPNDIFSNHKMAKVANQGNEKTSDSSSITGCLPEDSMCTTEKDGTVLKCSSSKDLQPHPKDETRFLDCTESKIQIYTCPPNLTFHPDKKKCEWQFVM